MNSIWENLIIAGFSGLFVALVLFVPLWGPQLAFRKRTPKPDRSRKVRYSLKDGMVLTIVLAALNALIAQIPDQGNDEYLVIFGVSMSALVVLLWIKCLRFMADYGIVEPRSRLIMHLFLYPLSTLVIAEIVSGVMMLLSSLEYFAHESRPTFYGYLRHPLPQAAICVIVLSLLTLFVIRRLFTKLVITSLEADSPLA